MIKRMKKRPQEEQENEEIVSAVTKSGKTIYIDGPDGVFIYVFSYSYDVPGGGVGFGRTKININKKIDDFEDISDIEFFIEKEAEINNAITVFYALIRDNSLVDQTTFEPEIY